MLKNFWYPIEFSSAITGNPKRLTVMGTPLVLYRKAGDNKVVAMSDWCAHRGAALSGGRRDGDCVRCPYHGWKYQPDGACIEIPANPRGAPVPKKARVRAYPAEDRYGWIWLFMGDLPEADRPPIPVLALRRSCDARGEGRIPVAGTLQPRRGKQHRYLAPALGPSPVYRPSLRPKHRPL